MLPYRSILAAVAIGAVCGCSSEPLAPPGPQSFQARAQYDSQSAPQGRFKELLYVANQQRPVTAFDARGSGYVPSVYQINNPNLPGSYWDLWSVAFDASGNLYVQTFLSDATSFVFAPHANGHVKPIRVFMGDGPDTRSIAVDSKGYEYIASSEYGARISVLPPKANGKPGNLYYVQPLRQFQTNESAFAPWPGILTIDSRGELVASLLRQQNALEFFQGGPNGSGTPVRTISGPNTKLGSCASNCENLTVAFSPLRRVFVGVTSPAPGQSRILAFSEDSNGNIAPWQDIEGSKTGLTGQALTGIAVSAQTGEIYAMVKNGEFGGNGYVSVFSAGANGNVAPVRQIRDPASGFKDALGIGLTHG
ncbi:MAG TPA: hypothetical protein VFA29_02795 [Candidatus Baltobacteraceae bacterium]|nr:hypothetical protein [Candidatus Baltobacteraceae bacterium]